MRNIKVIENLPFAVKPFQDITDTLTRDDKGDWEPDRTEDQIKRISVHHSAVDGGSPESYARYHVQTLGWRSIGYHMCIVGNQVFQTNSLLSFTYHTSSNNYDTVGVSVSGDLSKRGLTDDERNCLYAAILTLMSTFNIPVANVLGHREYPTNNTSCPCLDMNKLREDIAKLQLQMKAVSDPAQVKVNVYKATEQHRYLYNQYVSDPNSKWLEPYLLKMHEFMKENGMYFTG